MTSIDDEILAHLWEEWDSPSLTMERLLEMERESASDAVKSEIWHLISLKALERTKDHAKRAIEQDFNEPWIHDNHVFGSGFCNLDYNRTNNNELVEYYFTLEKNRPGSVISKRILIEQLIAAHRISEAEDVIRRAQKLFPDKQSMWLAYQAFCQWERGDRDAVDALANTADVAVSQSYLIQLMLAEHFAQHGLYAEAIGKYNSAFLAQTGKRKIDALICLHKIAEREGKHMEALHHIDKIIEVYKSDYACLEGFELDFWNAERIRLHEAIHPQTD